MILGVIASSKTQRGGKKENTFKCAYLYVWTVWVHLHQATLLASCNFWKTMLINNSSAGTDEKQKAN